MDRIPKMLLRSVTLAALLSTTAHAREAVVLIHGLARTSRSMARMEAAFTAAGYSVVNVQYPSRTASIKALSQDVVSQAMADERVRTCSRVHFVGHSLGAILVRNYFAGHTEPELGRVVMLGPPNQGSEVVDRLRSWALFRCINGPAGAELGTGEDSVPLSLGAVRFETGVIAGDRSINWINSLMIAGADDGKVSVARTHVDGMKEHLVVHVAHPFLMRNAAVIQATVRFIESGRFTSE